MILPSRYVTRVPEAADARLVFELIAACELDAHGEVEIDLEDIVSDWKRPGFDVTRDGALVIAPDGSLAGSCEVFASRAEGIVHPDHRGRGIGTWLAAWIERRAREQGAEFVRQVVGLANEPGLELLEAAGYERTDRAWSLEIDLDEVAPGAPLDPTVAIREFEPGRDDRIVWRLIEDAFSVWPDRVENPYESWRVLTIDRAGFEPHMLRVLHRHGEIIGATYSIDYPDDSYVWVQQVAIRGDLQRRGLGAALLRETFAHFRELGRRTAGLSTDSRTGALGMYERVGMRVKTEHVGLALRL